MVFKRRDKRPFWRILRESVWPRGGWARAFYYVRHRLHRLPDPPHRIARGIFAGVMASFTPFFGFHFLVAAVVALVIRGNVVASLLATFVGNPLTFLAIATLSFQTGNLVLGRIGTRGDLGHHTLAKNFVEAWTDLKHNFWSLFTDARPDWHNLEIFYDEVFLPYMVGGLIIGPLTGLVFYYLSLPVIKAYQNRRKGRLAKKLAALKEKAAAKAGKTEKTEKTD